MREFTLPLGITPAGATNPFIVIRPHAQFGIRVVELCLSTDDAAAIQVTPKRITGAVATIAGTAATAADISDLEASKATCMVDATPATGNGTAVWTGGPITSPCNTAVPLLLPVNWYVPPVDGFTVLFSGGAAPVNTGTDFTLTTNRGTIHFIADAAGTDTADTFYYTPGGTYAAAAQALCTKLNAVFGSSRCSVATATVTIPRYAGPGWEVTAIAEITDAGTDMTVATLNPTWFALYASAAKKVNGHLKFIEQGIVV